MKELVYWWRLVRGGNLLIMLLAQVLIYAYMLVPMGKSSDLGWAYGADMHILAVQALLLVAAAGYIINDFYDQKTDQINRPTKQILGQFINPNEAITVYVGLNVVALLVGWLLSGWYAGFLLLVAGLLFAYARWLKSVPLLGNLLISALCVAQFWQPLGLEWALIHDPKPEVYSGYYLRFVGEFSLLVLLLSMVRELIKTAEDQNGDAQAGLQTAAVAWGIPTVKNIILLLLGLVVLGLGWISWRCWVEAYHEQAIYTAWGLISTAIWLFFRIKKAQQPADFVPLSKAAKIYFLLGLGWWLLI